MNRPNFLVCAGLAILGLALITQPPCLARRRRTQSLVEESEREIKMRQAKPAEPLSIGTSPLLQQVAQTDERVAKQLEETEEQVRKDLEKAAAHARQVAKAGEEKLKKLEEEKNRLETKLQQQYQQSHQQVEQNFASQKSRLSSEITQQQTQIITKAEQAASARINRMEVALLEKHLYHKRNDITAPLVKATPMVSKDDLISWKEAKKAELSQSMAYLGPILDADPELSTMLKEKQLIIDTKITSSQAVGDNAYSVAEKEVAKLNLMHKTQKEADTLLSQALQKLENTSGDVRQQLRLTILYELPPLIENAAKTSSSISSEKLRSLVTKAVSLAQATPFDDPHDNIINDDGIPDIDPGLDVITPAKQRIAQQLAALKEELALVRSEKKRRA